MSRPNTQYATAHEDRDQQSPALQPDQRAGSEAVAQVPAPPPPHPPYDKLKQEAARVGEVMIEGFRLYEALCMSLIENKGPILLEKDVRALVARLRLAKSKAADLETVINLLRHPPKRKQGE